MKHPIQFDKNYCCQSTSCRFRSECAQHCTAGVCRQDDGFTPVIEYNVKSNEYLCVTCGGTCSSSCTTFPEDTCGFGMWSEKHLQSFQTIIAKEFQSTEQEQPTQSASDVPLKTAKEMATIATNVLEENSTINRIMALVESEARNGKYEVTFDFKSNDAPGIYEQLRKLGYVVQIQNFMDGDRMTVSWQ